MKPTDKMEIIMTEKQKLQKDRAWFKYVIAGLAKPINLDSLTEHEQYLWKQLLINREILLNNFDDNSNLKGLKVPEHRCWCGKEGKYKSHNYLHEGFVCKKHINLEAF